MEMLKKITRIDVDQDEIVVFVTDYGEYDYIDLTIVDKSTSKFHELTFTRSELVLLTSEIKRTIKKD